MPTPKIEFGLGSKQRTIAPQMGRWDLRNQKFIQGNPMPLKSWGIMVFNSPRAAAEQQVRNFVNTFIQIYTVHGGKVEDKASFFFLFLLIFANLYSESSYNVRRYSQGCLHQPF